MLSAVNNSVTRTISSWLIAAAESVEKKTKCFRSDLGEAESVIQTQVNHRCKGSTERLKGSKERRLDYRQVSSSLQGSTGAAVIIVYCINYYTYILHTIQIFKIHYETYGNGQNLDVTSDLFALDQPCLSPKHFQC